MRHFASYHGGFEGSTILCSTQLINQIETFLDLASCAMVNLHTDPNVRAGMMTITKSAADITRRQAILLPLSLCAQTRFPEWRIATIHAACRTIWEGWLPMRGRVVSNRLPASPARLRSRRVKNGPGAR